VIVFVHGVPETAALWDKLRAFLQRDSVAVSLPGFGCARPAEFAATHDAYVAWLCDEIGRLGPPVDLVGHDWGAALTYRVARAHGDLLRSWAADSAQMVHPDYEWHEVARVWQTPGEGEAFMEAYLSLTPEDAAAVFERDAVPHDDAVQLAAATDETMASCILDLYRSALPNPYSNWDVPWAATPARGLVLNPTEDPFGVVTMVEAVAEVLGAKIETVDGLGHWWMLQDPPRAAALLERFWASLTE
jgi:pimeloyl-ACP methyl ester carboxylesterase